MFNLRKLTAFFRSASPTTPYDRALRLIAAGAYIEAEGELSGLLASARTDSERATIVNKRGVARVHQGRRAEALEDFRAALGLNPSCAPALVNVGNLLLEDGAIDEAIAHYERAIRLDDAYGVAHMNLAAAYKQAGRHVDAVAEFRRAGRLEGRLFQKKKPRL